MIRPGLAPWVVGAAFGLAACSESPQQQAPTEPSLAQVSQTCDPNAFNSLISGYFSPPTQQEVSGYKDQMLAALPDSGMARQYGFNVLREIGKAARGTPQPDPSVGSRLTFEVLKCIFDVSDTLVIKPRPTATSFIKPLDHAHGGAYGVRGDGPTTISGTNDPTSTVQADSGTNHIVIAAIAPKAPATWNDIVTSPESRVLIYGEPGTTAGTYHLSMVRRNATFAAPGAVVTTCVDDNGDFSQMLTESNVGVLAYVEATSLCALVTGATTQSQGSFALLGRLVKFGRQLFAPQPLAATVVSPGLTGGTAGGLRSDFGVGSFTTLTVTAPTPTSPIVANTGRFELTVTVKSGSLFVNGTRLVLGVTNNSGVPTNIYTADPSSSCAGTSAPVGITGTGTNTPGVYKFTNLCITNTGAVKITITANVEGRVGAGSGITGKIKVIPQ